MLPLWSNSPDSRSEYWRSLDELARRQDGDRSAQDEFPEGAGELREDVVSRRNFLKLMSASLLLAGVGLSGCRRPEEEILPFAKEQVGTHGVAEYYATAMPRRRSAIPLVVKSNEGRPIKIEGNAKCSSTGGGTDAFAQASILGLYDPDRASHFAENGQKRSRQQAFDFLASRKLGDGTGLALLMAQSSSPSRERLVQQLRAKFPNARWFEYEPVNLNSPAEAASIIYGKPVRPHFQIDRAKCLLALDCDFLGAEENSTSHVRQFAATRHLDRAEDSMSRLYAVESLFTLTGANADHRLRAAPGLMLAITARFAQELLGPSASEFGSRLADLAAPARQFDPWITPCTRDLASAGGQALILPGHRLPLAAQVLVWAMNQSLGAVGQTVKFYPCPGTGEAPLSELAASLNAGRVQTLVILGGNPGFNAPVDLDWPHAQSKAQTVIRLGPYFDETSWNPELHAPVHWDILAAHYLESWGDVRTAEGLLLPVQPLIEPLFGGITDLELLARISGFETTNPYAIVRETFSQIAEPGDAAWNRFLHEGLREMTIAAPANVQPVWAEAVKIVQAAPTPVAPSIEKLDVVFHRDYSVDDGRFTNNGWLQELPDPITKLTWDNAILISPATGRELGLASENQTEASASTRIVEIQLSGRSVQGPLLVQPGMADHTIALALGYGRKRAGRIGNALGYNAYSIRCSASPHYASGALIRKTEREYPLAITQNHWSMEGRPIVREASLEQFRKDPGFAKKSDRPLPGGDTSLYPNPLQVAAQTAKSNQWGMSIDLNTCIGCSACVIACQSENNIPIVGKQMTAMSREMHWIRIDRYYTGPAENPQAVNQPMLCAHCEAAPCENVCPVNATVHDEEGLNVMVYNRCVGTRYCSNNCPFKVRRFNFFDYNRRPLGRLYKSPITSSDNGKWELASWFENRDRGSKPENEWLLARMVRNPEVTVRMRGVMEKCSFCQQRIEQARIAEKIRAANSAPDPLSERTGTIPQTACQQACPANAIVFGDISDPQSKVSIAKTSPRDYLELEYLNIKPRVSYRAKVRNPNPAMPLKNELFG